MCAVRLGAAHNRTDVMIKRIRETFITTLRYQSVIIIPKFLVYVLEGLKVLVLWNFDQIPRYQSFNKFGVM